jgi:hypothetical protein
MGGGEMTKLCKDCKWYRRNFFDHLVGSDYYDLCARPNDLNLVSGITKKYRCAYEREYDYLCGPDAKFFEDRGFWRTRK